MLLPTSELEAVNLMLEVINEPPINSLKDIGGTEAGVAYRILLECSRKIQQEGRSFNTDQARLLADDAGHVAIPLNVLKVQAVKAQYVERGRKMYDRVYATFVIANPVDVILVRFLGFEDLPEPARYYITVTAARKYAARVVGSQELVGLNERDEAEARLSFLEYELEQNRLHIFSCTDYSMIRRESSPNERGGLCL